MSSAFDPVIFAPSQNSVSYIDVTTVQENILPNLLMKQLFLNAQNKQTILQTVGERNENPSILSVLYTRSQY